MDSRFVDYDGKSVYDKITELEKKGGQTTGLKRIKTIINATENPVTLKIGRNRVTVQIGDGYDYSKSVGVITVVPQQDDFSIAGYGLTAQGIFLTIDAKVAGNFFGMIEVVQLN